MKGREVALTCTLNGLSMKLIVALIFLCVAPYCFALDAWEFSLSGLNNRGELVYYTPVTVDQERALVRDARGNFTRIRIEKFVDQDNRTVLHQCLWDRGGLLLICKEMDSKKKPVRYRSMLFKTKSGKKKFTIPIGSDIGEETIAAPAGAKKIQEALARKGSCTIPNAYFVCKENCPGKLPKEFLLVYCGD